VSRRLEFHGEVFHGTSGEIARRVVAGGGSLPGTLLMSTHGAAGPGVYVTDREDEAAMYGDHILRGYADAKNVLPAHVWNSSKLSNLASFSGGHAEKVRQHLIDRGYDAVEDGTVRGGISLLHPRQFELSAVLDPKHGHYRDVLHWADEITPPTPVGQRRRRAQRRSPAERVPEQVWSPRTFGH